MSEQNRLLSFALRYPRGWHSCARTDRRAVRAMDALARKGCLDVVRYGRGVNPQFRLSLPNDVRAMIDNETV